MTARVVAPARRTAPLREDFDAAIDPLLPALQFIWQTAYGYELEGWQVDELRHATELREDGHLRFRQYVISLGRQNGKSEIMAAFAIWRLLWRPAPLVIGIASSAEQARIVYQRAMRAISANPALAKRFDALTDTRGLRARDGGRYELKAAKGAALQGLAVDAAACDELHILKPELWNALLNGTGGRLDCIVLGITTAGDDGSELLKHLYANGDKSIAGDPGMRSFGISIYEASEARIPEDDETLAALLAEANPAIASGRIDVATVIGDVRSMPEDDAIRYRLNRFVASSGQFLGVAQWLMNGRGVDDVFPTGPLFFTFDRTPDWGHASVTVSVKRDGLIWQEQVASIVKPNLEQLVAIAEELAKHGPVMFGMDNYGLKELATELRLRGLPVFVFTQGDIISASAMFYSKVMRRQLRHANDALMTVQRPRTARKNIGEAFRISRKDSSVEIDAVMAHVLGVYLAETQKEQAVQVF